MPQHAVFASQGPFQPVNAADRQGDASPDAPHDAHTFSPPLAGNDVSAFDEALDHRMPEAAAHAASHDIETPQDGNNDNIPSGRALMIVDNNSTAIAAAGPSARTNMGRPVTIIGLLTVLGLGAAAFSYSGLGEPKKISAPQAQLTSVLPSAPETTTIVPPPSAAETNTASIVAPPLPSEAASVSAVTAPTRSVLPPASVPEEKTAVVTPEPAPSAVLPEPAPAPLAAEPASIPAQEANPAAAVAPQITPNNQPPATAAQPAPSVTPPPAGPGRGQFVFVQRPNVNIRNAPSDRSPIIGIAQFGGRFIVARSDGEWVQVAHGPWRGWINSRFLGSRLPRG